MQAREQILDGGAGAHPCEIAPPGGLRSAEWARSEHGRILCHTHLPAGAPSAGVVICSPLYIERSQTRRAELLLADALTAAGLAVQRFDYGGCGNSDGPASRLTFDSAVADCLVALDRLRERTALEALGIVGIRWGALVAAAAGSRACADAIVLWDAKVGGRDYFAELLQLRAFRDLRPAARFPSDPAFHEARLRRGIPVDLRGWRIHAAVVESSLGASVSQLTTRALPTLLVGTAGRRSRVDCEQLEGELLEIGCDVEVRVLPGRQWWWLGGNPLMDSETEPAAFESAAVPTASWLKARLAP